MFKTSKLIFIAFIILGTLISISSNSWLMVWLGMEINIISITPMMVDEKGMFSKESSMKYFIIQAMGSSIFLFSLIILMFSFLDFLLIKWIKNFNFIMIQTALMMKLGMMPFYFWFPEVINGLSWFNSFIILTWQKITPLTLIMMTFNLNLFFVISSLMTSLVGSLLSINQNSMRKILAYSSMNHMSWMTFSMLIYSKVWMIYFLFYTIMTFNLTIMLNNYKIFLLSQMFSMNLKKSSLLMILLNLLSMGGIPPLVGFLPKWMVISNFLYFNMFFLPLTLITFTMLSIYLYLRILSIILLTKKMSSFHKNNSSLSFSFFMWNFMFLFSMMFLIILFEF